MFTLYHSNNSVCSQKVRLVLHEKGVTDWDNRQVDLFRGGQFDPDYLKLNPKGVVPTLVHDGHVLVESTLIAEYLDDILPDPPLKPADPVARAEMRLYPKACDEGLHQGVAVLSYAAAFIEKLRVMQADQAEAHLASIPDLERRDRQTAIYHLGIEAPHIYRGVAAYEKIFQKIDKALADGRPWLMGDLFSLAEINLAPYVARLDDLSLLDIWTADRPAVTAWYARIADRPSFRAEIADRVAEDDRAKMRTGGARIAPQVAAHRETYLATDSAARLV